jgi:hypothetical protein
VIVAIGSDKGSPGATTLATVLGLVWPSPDRVVVELDPRGADLPYRLMLAGGQPMATAPSIAALAVDARPGAAAAQLGRYAQPTALGVPVIPGELSSRANGRIAAHLPAIAAAAAAWPGTALADLGGLHPSNPAMVLARAAEAVLLVTRPSLEGLGHLRDRIDELTELVGDPRRTGSTVGVVLVAEPGNGASAMAQAAKLLESIGSPATVVGVLAHDPASARALWSGPASRKLLRGPLVQSGRALADRIRQCWPVLGGGAVPSGHWVAAGQP